MRFLNEYQAGGKMSFQNGTIVTCPIISDVLTSR